jgi:hypothetical protein
MRKIFGYILICTFLSLLLQCNNKGDNKYKPQIDSEWWNIAGNPDLGVYNSPKQQPVD